jgi:hypothetical protein
VTTETKDYLDEIEKRAVVEIGRLIADMGAVDRRLLCVVRRAWLAGAEFALRQCEAIANDNDMIAPPRAH